MQTEPETPPPEDPAEAERVARILARYQAEHPEADAATPELAAQVRQALDELHRPGDPAPAPTPPPLRRAADEGSPGISRWQRLLLAAVAAGLIALFWQRLGWVG